MRASDLWAGLAVGVGATAVGLIAVASPQAAAGLALALGIACAIWVLTRLLPPSALSPIYFALALYVLAGVAGGLSYGLLRTGKGSPVPGYTNEITFLAAHLVPSTAMIYGAAALFTAVGAAALTALTETKAAPIGSLRPTAVRGWEVSWLVLVVAGVIPLLLTVAGLHGGLGYLLHRADYIANRVAARGPYSIGIVVSIAIVAAAGFVWSTASTSAKRWWALGLGGVYFLLFLGLGSRTLAGIPVVFAAGALVADPASRRLKRIFAGTMALALPLLALTLYLRSASDHGLFAVPTVLSGGDPTAAFPGWDVLQINLLNTFGATGGAALSEPALPIRDFWLSVNPLPGGVVGWHAREAFHQFDAFNPYSSLGELGNYGTVWLCSYFLLFGAALAAIDLWARALARQGSPLFAFCLIALASLAPLLSLQYSLRTTTRVLYYTGAIILIGLVLRARRDRGGVEALRGETIA